MSMTTSDASRYFGAATAPEAMATLSRAALGDQLGVVRLGAGTGATLVPLTARNLPQCSRASITASSGR